MSVRIHIEHVLVEGVQLNQRDLPDIERAVRERLAELLSTRSIPLQNWRDMGADSAQPIAMTLDPRPTGDTFGSSLAQTLFASVCRS